MGIEETSHDNPAKVMIIWAFEILYTLIDNIIKGVIPYACMSAVTHIWVGTPIAMLFYCNAYWNDKYFTNGN